jgi:hypothetical protein
MIVFRLALGQAEPPAIIVDRDGDVVRIVERRRAPVERRVIEVPLRRSQLPDELSEVVSVFVVSCPAAVGGEVVLVPPLELRRRGQRYLAGFLAADQIPAHRDERPAAFGPERRDDVGCPCAQSKPATIAFLILRASMSAMVSMASADCWPLRNVLPERKRVVP